MDVGTLEAYWQSHMDLLEHPPPLDLNDRSWIIHTRSEERPPVTIQEGAIVQGQPDHRRLRHRAGGAVERSVLSPGRVDRRRTRSCATRSILTDASIEAGARVERAIVDKSVRIGKGAKVGGRLRAAESDGLGLTTVGKNAQIAEKTEIPIGAVIDSDEEAAPPRRER